MTRSEDADNHPWYAGIVESVGWSVSDKRAKRLYQRDYSNGAFLTDENNDPLPDTDFARVLSELNGQRMHSAFSWLAGQEHHNAPSMWSVDFSKVIARPDRSLDPKRWSERHRSVGDAIRSVDHFILGDVVDVIAQEGRPDAISDVFDYVLIDDVVDGHTTPQKLRGWQLPSRARHRAVPGDIFVGAVWSSVSKWFVAGEGCENMVVSNGFIRLRMKPNHEDHLLDIVSGLVS